MTEIPEHLLKRSRERRQALGLPTDGGDETSAAPAASAPATTSSTPAVAAAAPAPARAAKAAPAAAPPPKPDIPLVAAAKRRKKIPMWAMATLSILPLWAFMYVRALTPGPVKASGPIAEGQKVYSSAGCASCHGADGSGGVGRPFAGGEVLKTFPRIEDQLNFVDNGSQAFASAGLPIYGNPNRAGGPHAPLSFGGAAMPAQKDSLTQAQILGVVCHERYDLAGASADPRYEAEFEKWCGPTSEIFTGLEDGSLTFDTPALQVGTKPRPALPDQTPPAAAG